MISSETRRIVIERAGYRCEVSGELICEGKKVEIHHIYTRNEYKGRDRDEPWNLAAILEPYHTAAWGPQAVHGGNKEADRLLRARADRDKPPHLRAGGRHPDLDRQRAARKKNRERQIARFKEQNGGLTPGQVAYRRAKARAKKLKGGDDR